MSKLISAFEIHLLEAWDQLVNDSLKFTSSDT